MTPEPAGERARVRRKPERARYDRETIGAILDAAPICHVSFVIDGDPVAIPTIHARAGEVLYLHGSPANRTFDALRDGRPVCVSAAIVDGVVLTRSAKGHSMNYRSVVLFGRAREVTDPGEKARALRAVVEHVVPGRWDEVRPPDEKELASTFVLRLEVDEASAKVRTGPAVDAGDGPDEAWAGVVPLSVVAGAPSPEDGVTAEPPGSVRRLLDG